MNNKIFLFLIFIFSFTFLVETGNNENPLSERKVGNISIDGNSWLLIDKSFNNDSEIEFIKIMMLHCIVEGAQYSDSSSVFYKNLPTSIKYGDLVKALDEFYNDYRNVNLPLIVALRHINSQLEGSSPDTLDMILRLFRKIFNNAAKK